MLTFARYIAFPLIYCGALLAFATSTLEAAELFVADRVTNRILSFDETTGEFLRVVTATGISEPSGLTMGPGGYLYVSNLQAGVAKIDPLTGATETGFIDDIIGPGGIAYHEASDTLFVSEFGNFDGDEVFRYDASGTRIQTIGTGSPATGRAGMTFDSAGNLYVSETNYTLTTADPSSVLKYDASNGFAPLGVFASGSMVTTTFMPFASGFNGLTFDDAGNLYVAALGSQVVVKFSVSEGAVTEGAQFGEPFPYPSGLIIQENGDLLLTSLGNNNPGDQIWGPATFPGSLYRFDAATSGSQIFIPGGNAADLNGNASVDGADLVEWQSAYNLNATGDIDGDNDTDGSDFLAWQRAFGDQSALQPTGIVRYAPHVESLVVPEPASLCMVFVAMAGYCLGRRSSSRHV